MALLQHASSPLYDETAQGVIDGLAAGGFRDGKEIRLHRFNAEGDIPTANLIASRVADGSFRLTATISTICLQAVSNANRAGKTTQVFCAVSAPVAAGVGIKELGSLEKPAHLTGIGTAQPVEDIFRAIRRIHPALRRVGVVWNPAEANSLVTVQRARAICKELGLELVEASIEGTRDVKESTNAVVSRGAEAVWVGGDATVLSAMDTLVGVVQQARIPFFSNISGHVRRGALLDLGANYYQVGHKAGEIAAEILAGRPAAEIAVEDFMPREIGLNFQVLATLKGGWQIPAEVRAEAATIIEADGSVTQKNAPTPEPARRAEPYRISAVGYIESVPTEESTSGFLRGLKEAGLEEGRDFVWNYRSAQGDLSVLSTIFAAVEREKPDLVAVFSTPTLQNALQRLRHLPIVFALVADPVSAGAGKSKEEHDPRVTGVSVLGPYDGMAELLTTHYPQWKTIGALMTPSEENSVITNRLFREALERRGLKLVSVPVNHSTELSEAAAALCRQVDAVVQVPDNLVSAGFTAIAAAARRARVPLFGLAQVHARHGAALALSRDYEDAGHDAGLVAARVLRGEAPANIPFKDPSRTVLTVNPEAATAQGVTLTPELLEKADLTLK